MSQPNLPAAHRRRDGVRSALAASALLIALAAHAGTFGIGASAGLDRGKVDCVAAYPCDHTGTDAKLFATYGITDAIELEALFFDAGRFDGGDTSPLGTPFGGRFKVSGAGIAAGYRWAFAPDWSIKAQLGIASVRTRFDHAAPFEGSASRTTTQPLLGLSLGHAITPSWRLSLDFDASRFEVHTTRGSLQMLGIAAQYTF